MSSGLSAALIQGVARFSGLELGFLDRSFVSVPVAGDLPQLELGANPRSPDTDPEPFWESSTLVAEPCAMLDG